VCSKLVASRHFELAVDTSAVGGSHRSHLGHRMRNRGPVYRLFGLIILICLDLGLRQSFGATANSSYISMLQSLFTLSICVSAINAAPAGNSTVTFVPGMQKGMFGSTFTTKEGDRYKVISHVSADNRPEMDAIPHVATDYVAAALDANGVRDFSKPLITIKEIAIQDSGCIGCMSVASEFDFANAPFVCESLVLKRIDRLVSDFVITKDGSKLYMPMKYVSGKRLSKMLQDRAFAMEDYQTMFRSAARSLMDMHNIGILHGNARISNFIVHEQALGGDWINFAMSLVDRESATEETDPQCMVDLAAAKEAELQTFKKSFWSALGYDTTVKKALPGNYLDVSDISDMEQHADMPAVMHE
jgi:tRNA A-37 threonylcarbamoyl transferase component Bud32